MTDVETRLNQLVQMAKKMPFELKTFYHGMAVGMGVLNLSQIKGRNLTADEIVLGGAFSELAIFGEYLA